MARKADRGKFVPNNPKKYIGTNINNIVFRSSWEKMFMFLVDSHPNVVAWLSEGIKIPYEVPEIRNGKLFRRSTLYIPDFFIIYLDKNGKEHKELLEIKPKDETPWYEGRVSKLKEARQMMNQLKWQAALKFCHARGWSFRIATEAELFAFTRQNR